MVKKEHFRIGCLVAGFFGIILLILSNGEKFMKVLGILLCIVLMVFGMVVTGKWGKFIIGTETEGEQPDGVMG